MVKEFNFFMAFLVMLCLGATAPAWAQSCPSGQTPICKKVGNSVGVLNADKTKCIYSPLCSSTGEAPVNGNCADVLVCPTGTTGTPPNNCVTTDRECPSNSVLLADGTCSAAPPLDGYYDCPTPSVWDSAEEKCLFDVGASGSETTSDPFCPNGYYKENDHCAQRQACPNGIWSDPCIAHPDSDAICTQADADTPF